MSHYLHGPVVIALCALAAGCASMSENQCRTANWYQQGETDGLLGQQARLDQYKYQCAKYQVLPVENDYLAGWSDGYAEYNRRVGGSKM